jgi:uncharacterized protein (TIGR02611 family)
LRFILHQSFRLSVATVGFTVMGAGFVMLVTPGPGLLVIIAGLAILAHEFTWAQRALEQARERAARAREAASRRTLRRPPG